MNTATRSLARAVVRTTTRTTLAAAPRQAFRQQGRRSYSSEAPKSESSTWLWAAGAAAVVAGGTGYWYSQQGRPSTPVVPKAFTPTKADYQKVYDEIAS